ncbi:hypothetical protein [Deinococcus hohokamensis]|uniref:Big-1 domain-containing protein n=1 Tax=Deinococcus hohokamensis TaxID=309883 RepID=A0ABV9I6B5_9DEIO
MKHSLILLTALLATTAAASTAQPALLAQVAQAPQLQRESTITVAFDATGGTDLLIAQALPEGARYVPGSAALNGTPVADPRIGLSGRLYFTPDLARGTLTYRVTHTGALGSFPQAALRATYGSLGIQALQGEIEESDWVSAQDAGVALTDENSGAIKLPLANSVISGRDSANVTVVRALGEDTILAVNGVAIADDRIGQRTTDPTLGTERLTYVAVPLLEGENRLTFGGETITLLRPGAATDVRAELVQDVADGVTPLTVRLTLLDARGLPASDASVTLVSDPEPSGTDSNTGAAGFQTALVGGVATVNLTALTTPRPVTFQVLIGDELRTLTLTTRPSGRQVAVGVGSVTVGVAPFGVWDARGALTLETPVLGGQLYVHADSQGAMQSAPADSWTTFGDASGQTQPLPSLNGVGVLYDRPEFQARYGLVGEGSTLAAVSPAQGVRVVSKGDFSVRAFASSMSRDIREVTLPGDGSRQYRLPGAAVNGTAQLWVVAQNRNSGDLRRDALQPGIDYVLEADTGLIILARPLPLLNENLERQALLVQYRPVGGTDEVLAWGVEGQGKFGTSLVTAGVLNDGRHQTTFGVKVAVREATWAADARALYASGLNVSVRGGFSGNWSGGGSVTYADKSYAGSDALIPGLNANANLSRTVAGPWGVQLTGDLHSAETFSAHVAAQATYALKPWTFGLGAQAGFGTAAGISAIGSVAYAEGPVSLKASQTIPVSGGRPETVVAGSWKVAPNVTLQATGALKAGELAAEFGVASTVRGTNLSASYATPGHSGEAGRMQFGADTALPLGDNTTLGLRGSASIGTDGTNGQVGGGASLHVQSDDANGTFGIDAGVQDGQATFGVNAGGVWRVSDEFTLTGNAQVHTGATFGARASLGAAWRDDNQSLLLQSRVNLGDYSPENAAHVDAAYTRFGREWAWRVGAGAHVPFKDQGGTEVHALVGATRYFGAFGVGAQAGVVSLPALSSTALLLGLEGSARITPGTWFTLGYNLFGSEASFTPTGRKGAYLRLDVLLDDGDQK